MRFIAALLLLLTGLPAAAEEVVAGLSQDRVQITTSFHGSEISIYGAVYREIAPPDGDIDVIVTVMGPSTPVIVRKKERRLGIWVKGEGVKVDAAPSFYAVATTRPFREIISYTDDLRYKVGLNYAVRLIGESHAARYPADYRRAVIRLREAEGMYVALPGTVEISRHTLFRTRVQLPPKLVEGDYKTRIFLLRNKKVIDVHETSILVRKVGLERWLFNMSQEQGLLYGLLSIAVALAAGWLASAVFRLFP